MIFVGTYLLIGVVSIILGSVLPVLFISRKFGMNYNEAVTKLSEAAITHSSYCMPVNGNYNSALLTIVVMGIATWPMFIIDVIKTTYYAVKR